MILLECAVERPQNSICCISGQDCVEIRQIIDLACDNHRIDDSQGLSFRTESNVVRQSTTIGLLGSCIVDDPLAEFMCHYGYQDAVLVRIVIYIHGCLDSSLVKNDYSGLSGLILAFEFAKHYGETF